MGKKAILIFCLFVLVCAGLVSFSLHLLDRDGDGSWSRLKKTIDCDDEDFLIHPNAEDIPFNGVDENCNGADDLTGANILLITIDCLRADHVGAYGYERNTTPNIDELAKKSAVFLNAYTLSPWTHPSLASIHTGRHPRDHGVRQWGHKLKEEHSTLAEVLKSYGYATEAYVSHKLFKPNYKYTQGFDHYDYSILKKGFIKNFSSSKELTDSVLRRLGKINKPFFIWIHYFDPHDYYLTHKGFDFGTRPVDRYDSEIAYTDYHIKRLFDVLKKRGLFNTTIIVVVADHGEEFQDHRGIYHRYSLYQELIHIPLIIHVPGFKHKEVNTVVDESDIAPTIIKLVGLPIPSDFRGVSISLSDEGRNLRNKTIYAEQRQEGNLTSIIEGEFKLIINHKNDKMELYNLRKDPFEKNNLIHDEREKGEELRGKIVRFYQKNTEKSEALKLSDETLQNLKDLGYLV